MKSLLLFYWLGPDRQSLTESGFSPSFSYEFNMKRNLVFILLSCVSALVCASPQHFEEARRVGEELDATFFWSSPTITVEFSARGLFKEARMKKQARRKWGLPVDESSFIQQAFVLPVATEVLISYEMTDGESGFGAVCRVDLKTAVIRWCQEIPGFNLYSVVGDSGAIFVAAIGFVGSVDAMTGRYLWRQSNLRDGAEPINLLCDFQENATTISFQASSGIPHTPATRITFNKRTGKMLGTSRPVSVTEFCQ